MKSIALVGLVFGLSMIFSATPARSDEANGTITDTGFGSYKIDDNGTMREFNISRGKSVYEPVNWRPEKGDKVSITFSVTPNKRGKTVLAVQKTTLIKAGPNTIADLASPVTVTVVETGISGVKVKLPKGQIIKFDYKRGNATEKVPAGWVELPGEKAIITFQVQRNRWTDNINYVADKVEKVK
jgi:hypothetical protein